MTRVCMPLALAAALSLVLSAGLASGCGGKSQNCQSPARDGDDALAAFPGAEGFGGGATGGRGGRVYIVETLDPTGEGSLQAGLDLDEPRIIVFRVSGVIEGDITIPYGNVTIAGQTAPGAGITIRGRITGVDGFGVDNIVIRHLRVRPNAGGGGGETLDSIQLPRGHRVMLDHLSVAFGVDETIDLYQAQDVTVQWSVIESSATEGHPEGQHNYGLINGPGGIAVSVHHNLFAHHKNRTPALANGPAEVLNNVMYNVRHGFVHHNPAAGPFNIAGNYFKRGADDVLIPFYFDDEDDFRDPQLGYYLRGNYIDDPDPEGKCNGLVHNPWKECTQELLASERLRSQRRYDFSTSGPCYFPVTAESAQDAYRSVLAGAGAFPRDEVTRRSIKDTVERTGQWGAYEVDLMAGLTPTEPPDDLDEDGMADDWEEENGLDPDDSSDHARVMDSGYTAIEEHINQLADELVR